MTRLLNMISDCHLAPRRGARRRGAALLALLAGVALWSPSLSAQQAQPAAPTAPAQAPAEVATGIVRVTSAVRGAVVYIDNELAGEAPVTRYLPVGPHTVRITADNFDPFVRRVEVKPGTTVDVEGNLVAGNGTVEFIVQPVGAVLFLNNREEGKTPARLRDLRDGEYRYRLEAPGHEPEEGTFTFKRGKNLLINARMKSTAGLVEVNSRPAGARVWLDGVSVGTTPLVLSDVSPGPHVLRIEHPDTATVIRKLDNSDGGKATVEARLPDAGARLSVETGHADATVKLEGVSIGQGETVRLHLLERGRYQLEVSAPGHQPASTTVEVPSSGKVTLSAKLRPEGDPIVSKVEPARSLLGRWTFWAAVAAGAGAAGATAAVVASVGEGEGEGEGESPDLVVELP